MRYSKMFIPTMKENPADAQVVSHRLMMRAGMIRKVAAGIYTYLPLGLRVLQKISQIIRDELGKAGAQEIQMPIVQPAELWEKSGRWGEYGSELLRIKDRKQTDFCLGPTHEEVVTQLVANHINSYRQLPLNLYQIQTKFRDEVRPKFGLMRGREFLMKDAYSFSLDKAGAEESYDEMKAAYGRIFARFGLKFSTVEADTGSIGGNRSHEFQVLVSTGEDKIAKCNSCGYAANVELAVISPNKNTEQNIGNLKTAQEVDTPNKKTIEEVADFLGLEESKLIKALMFMADDKPLMALCRGDHELNKAKLKRELDVSNLNMMNDEEIERFAGPVGYVGPVGLAKNIRVVCDWALKGNSQMIAGALKVGKHLAHVAVGRDFEPEYFDLRKVHAGDSCGKCGEQFSIECGIEVAHIFYLGTKYSQSMHAVALDEQGRECLLEMGCYGIGVGRTAAAAIEQNHDENGIIWPMAIAPFQVSLLCLDQDEAVIQASEKLYSDLVDLGLEVLFDDRNERPGVKFKDNDLLGCPIRVSVGMRGLAEGKVELGWRKEGKDGATKIFVKEVALVVKKMCEEALGKIP